MLLIGARNEYDVIITELGGTVGDIESLPFIEAVRQLQWELPEDDVVVIHLTLIPYLKAAKELKNKTHPAQCSNAEPGRCFAGYYRMPHRRTTHT
jgi:CTP synthase (UTP-ammonia lyase)